MVEEAKSIIALIEEQNKRWCQTINLVASENILSPDAQRALASDFAHRYCLPPDKPDTIWDYPNQETARAIYARTAALACELFHGAYADLRPLSGNNVAYVVLKGLRPANGDVFSVPANCGGHFTTRVICKEEKLCAHDIPFNTQTGLVDLDAFEYRTKKAVAPLVFLDTSMTLFPQPVREMRKILGEEAVISYDASHTLGLVAGGAFQAPLDEGADLVHGSTHKSFFGPQKGIIVCRDNVEDPKKIAARIRDIVVPLFVSNPHVHHIATLGVACEEMKHYGQAYAAQVVKNAKAFGEELFNRGGKVLFAEKGFTETHQILCDVGEKDVMFAAFYRLEEAGIHLNGIRTPFSGAYGFRIGLAEATRREMREEEMRLIARLVADVMQQRRSTDAVRKDVSDLSARFIRCGYCQNGAEQNVGSGSN